MKEQFEVWLFNLNQARGTEPGKIKPAVVVQINLLNQLNHLSTLISPITTMLSDFENILLVRVDAVGTGLAGTSEVLVDQIRALNNRRFLEKLGKINPIKTLELKEKLGPVLDF